MQTIPNNICTRVNMDNIQGNIFFIIYRDSLQQEAKSPKNQKIYCFFESWWFLGGRGQEFLGNVLNVWEEGGLPKLNNVQTRWIGSTFFSFYDIVIIEWPLLLLLTLFENSLGLGIFVKVYIGYQPLFLKKHHPP